MASKQLRITFADDTTIDVTPNLFDTLNFETTLRKNPSWGKLEQNALRMTPFRAWSAARRQNLTDLTWDQFTAPDSPVQDVSSVDDDEDDEDDDPFLG